MYNLSGLNITAGGEENGYIEKYALDVYTSLGVPSKQCITSDGYIFYEKGDIRYLLGYTGDKTELNLPENCNGSPQRGHIV